MFGRSDQLVFRSYGRRRSRWRPPRWLVLLLAGTALGAGGVVWMQERYLPPRLSASASAELQRDFDQAERERQRLQGELGRVAKRLELALAEAKAAAEQLAGSRAAADRARDDLAATVALLPPDPRGGAVAVRAGRFVAQDGQLRYDLALTRDGPTGRPLAGILQLQMSGESARGAPATVEAKPVALSLGSHELVRGSLPLPDGFRPRQTTVRVLDRATGQPVGMRVLLVQ
jgi:hypothetical protein